MTTRVVSKTIDLTSAPSETTISKYITRISDRGIEIHPEVQTNNNYLQLDGTGLYLKDSTNTSIAFFTTEETQVGTDEGNHISITNNDVSIAFGDEAPFFDVGLTNTQPSLYVFNKQEHPYELEYWPHVIPTTEDETITYTLNNPINFNAGEVKLSVQIYPFDSTSSSGVGEPIGQTMIIEEPNNYGFYNFSKDGIYYTASWTVTIEEDSITIISDVDLDQRIYAVSIVLRYYNYTLAPTLSFGLDNTVSGNYASAIGFNNVSSGQASLAIGTNNIVSNSDSFVCGRNNLINSWQSFAIGQNNIVSSYNQAVFGKYNVEDNNNTYGLIIGNGAENARSNALTVDWSGNIEASGGITLNNNVHANSSILNQDETTIPSSNIYGSGFYANDKNGKRIGRFTSIHNTSDQMGAIMSGVRSVNGLAITNNFIVYVDANGDQHYAVSNDANFRSDMGINDASNLTTGTLPGARLPVLLKVQAFTSGKFTQAAGAGTDLAQTITVPDGYELVGVVGCVSAHNIASSLGSARKTAATQVKMSTTNRTSSQWTDMTHTVYVLFALSNVF